MLHAIFETGGKQYSVSEGDVVYIEKIDNADGDEVTFGKVLALISDTDSRFGTPILDGATVSAKIIKNGKGKKIHIFKYKAKKNERKRQGHRQPYTQIQIQAIVG